MFRLTITVAIISVFMLPGCGSSGGATTAKKVSANGTTTTPPCKEQSCPQIQLSINAAPMQGNVLTGDTLNNQPFKITGAPADGVRDIRMMAFNPPKGGQFTGQGSLNIQATYNSIEAVQAQVPMDVLIRDVSRCKNEAPQAAEQCGNMQATGFEAFESRQQLNWQITEAPIENFMDPTFTANQGPLMGANSGLQGCGQGFVNGGLGGLAGGSPLGAIIGGVGGCLGTSIGNLGQGQ